MKFELLNKAEQFEKLKRNDFIIVKWSDYYIKHTEGAKKITPYNIYKNADYDHEIICRRKNNHYFNWNLYLKGESNALEVYKVSEN